MGANRGVGRMTDGKAGIMNMINIMISNMSLQLL